MQLTSSPCRKSIRFAKYRQFPPIRAHFSLTDTHDGSSKEHVSNLFLMWQIAKSLQVSFLKQLSFQTHPNNNVDDDDENETMTKHFKILLISTGPSPLSEVSCLMP